MTYLLNRCLSRLRQINRLRYIVLLAFFALIGVSFFHQPLVKIQQAQNKTSPLPLNQKPGTATHYTSPYAVKPGPPSIPQITSQPIPPIKPIPMALSAPTNSVTPAPDSSVPSLKPAAVSGSTVTTGSTTSGSGTGGSTNNNSGSTSTSTAYQSTNWSGYFSATAGIKYISVSAVWTAGSPTNSGGGNAYDANWIGIGGITSSDLIQVGINDEVTANGQVLEQAFYETLPAPAVTISSLAVAPGDSIKASIYLSGSNTWVIEINDTTKNQTFNKTISYNSSLSSAEWIEEDPSGVNGSTLPLDDFGTINFFQTFASANGTTEDLTQLNAANITMVDSAGNPEAVPSTIGADGASFSVKWQ